VVREVRPDSGAAQAGLRVDDAILAVNDVPVLGLTVDEAIALIRGEPETWVRLLIARDGEENREYRVRRTNTITRETVQAGFLRDAYLPGHRIAYIFIDYFAANTGTMFQELIDSVVEDGAEAVVLDLRFNGGGDVRATMQVAGRLLPNGELMRLALRDGEQRFTISGAKPIDIPFVILVNGASASASEILAGAVQDSGRGLLVGTPTFGKGSVQTVFRLPTGSGLRVTEGLYYLPGGRLIDGQGVTPDFVVENDLDSDDDAQLIKALELLKQLIDGTETVASLLENR